MHAMPSLSLPHRRLTFKRLFLALVLGLAAWWGVGWWLSPRPLYTLAYPTDPITRQTLDTNILTAGQLHFRAMGLDREGHLLLVQAPLSSDPPPDDGLHRFVRWEIRDLPTGRLLANYELPEAEVSRYYFDNTNAPP